MRANWRIIFCPGCGGLGVKGSWGGGPVDCYDCQGGGTFHVLPSGQLAHWPGGPFAGSTSSAAWESGQVITVEEA